MYYYVAYGLNLASELECPGFCQVEASNHNDVEICLGRMPEELDHVTPQGGLFHINENQLLFDIKPAGRYLISEGRQVIIERNPSASNDMVRLFLWTAGIGALLHQRGALPLHGSAIAVDQGAMLFLGQSGMGKSTLAGAFQRNGYTVIADDICALTIRPQSCQIAPGHPEMGLWADSAQQLGLSPEQLTRTRPQAQKYVVPVENQVIQPLPVSSIYILETYPGPTVQITPLKGFEKMEAIKPHIYRLRYLKGMAGWRNHLEQLHHLARQVRIALVRRPNQGFHLEALTTQIETDFRRG